MSKPVILLGTPSFDSGRSFFPVHAPIWVWRRFFCDPPAARSEPHLEEGKASFIRESTRSWNVFSCVFEGFPYRNIALWDRSALSKKRFPHMEKNNYITRGFRRIFDTKVCFCSKPAAADEICPPSTVSPTSRAFSCGSVGMYACKHART